MGSLDYAAYDPIFWMHHANVDRQWALWQRSHDGTVVPRLDYSLPDVDMTVGKTVDHRKTLGYDYVANECFERFSRDNVDAGMVAFNDSPTQYSVADLADGFDSAVLEFHNVGHPLEGTREIRVFINQPGANADSDTEGRFESALRCRFTYLATAKRCATARLPGTARSTPMDRQKFDVRTAPTRPPMKPLKVYMDVTRTHCGAARQSSRRYRIARWLPWLSSTKTAIRYRSTPSADGRVVVHHPRWNWKASGALRRCGVLRAALTTCGRQR